MKPARIQIEMFGGFSMSYCGNRFGGEGVSSPLLCKLFTYLITFREREIPQTELMDILWGDDANLKNPQSALKTLIHRARAALDKLGLDGKAQILYHKGAYLWNSNAVDQSIDIDNFEYLCEQAEATPNPDAAQSLRQKAASLYKGEFLPGLSSEAWVLPLSVYYGSKYVNLVYAMADQYVKNGQNEEILGLCKTALNLFPYDESINQFLIEALLRLSRPQLALMHYDKVVKLFQEQFDVEPPQEFSQLYKYIMRELESGETSLSEVVSEIRDGDTCGGAYYCDPPVFVEICRYDARTRLRSGGVSYLAMLTLKNLVNDAPDKAAMEQASRILHSAIRDSLRSGDCFTRLNSVQYALILQSITYEKGTMVIERVINAYKNNSCNSRVSVTYNLELLRPKAMSNILNRQNTQ